MTSTFFRTVSTLGAGPSDDVSAATASKVAPVIVDSDLGLKRSSASAMYAGMGICPSAGHGHRIGHRTGASGQFFLAEKGIRGRRVAPSVAPHLSASPLRERKPRVYGAFEEPTRGFEP